MYIINAKMGLTVKDLKDRIDNFKIIECGEPVYGLYAFLNNDNTIYRLRDSHIKFSTENYTEAESSSDEDGQFRTPGFKAGYDITCSIPFRWVAAGGDWEKPVVFIVFINQHDELDVYVPKDGNVYDKDKNAAYGNYECKSVYDAKDEKYDQIAMRNEFWNYIQYKGGD